MRFSNLLLIGLVISGFLVVSAVSVAEEATMRITVDNVLATLYINGEEIELDLAAAGNWEVANIVQFEMIRGINVIALHCTDAGVIAGLLADITYGDAVRNTDDTWKYILKDDAGYEDIDFDDSDWANAVIYHQYPTGIWAQRVPAMNDPMSEAFWIWSDTNVQDGNIDASVFFRFTFGEELSVAPRGKIATTWGQMKKQR